MASILFDSVCKNYPGGVVALDDVSFHIRDGSFVVFVGPSGSGKSTILRLIAGLERPTAGGIYMNGRDVSGLSPRDRDVAMVFQEHMTYPHLTVYDNIAFGLRCRRSPKSAINATVSHAAERLGLTTVLKRKPTTLSGGQQQRVALARALVRMPQAFLLDEPLANLDAPLRNDIRLLLQELHRDMNCPFVYVTHDQVEALTLGDHVCVIHDGVIQQGGTPLELYRSPRNVFVAKFVGWPPMNIYAANSSLGSALLRSFAGEAPTYPLDRLLIGIRPEDLSVNRTIAQVTVAARVRLVETLGADLLVHCVASNSQEQVRIRIRSNRRLAVGDSIDIGIPRADSFYLFDATTGAAVRTACGRTGVEDASVSPSPLWGAQN